MNQNNNQNTTQGFNETPLGYVNPSMYTNNTNIQTNITPSNNNETDNKKKSNLPVIIVVVVVLVAALAGGILYEVKMKPDSTDSLDNKKALVVYYSREGENYGYNLAEKVTLEKGNTEVMAEKIAEFIGADLYRIIPSVPYPEDLDELYIQTQKELNSDYYPEISGSVDISSYDVIFIGYPIWHQSYPQIIKTFIRDNPSLKDKIIVPFNTHAGAGNAGTYKSMSKLIEGATFKDGFNLNGTEVSSSDDQIKDWLKSIGYKNIK